MIPLNVGPHWSKRIQAEWGTSLMSGLRQAASRRTAKRIQAAHCIDGGGKPDDETRGSQRQAYL